MPLFSTVRYVWLFSKTLKAVRTVIFTVLLICLTFANWAFAESKQDQSLILQKINAKVNEQLHTYALSSCLAALKSKDHRLDKQLDKLNYQGANRVTSITMGDIIDFDPIKTLKPLQKKIADETAKIELLTTKDSSADFDGTFALPVKTCFQVLNRPRIAKYMDELAKAQFKWEKSSYLEDSSDYFWAE